jgi:hypothetical protein
MVFKNSVSVPFVGRHVPPPPYRPLCAFFKNIPLQRWIDRSVEWLASRRRFRLRLYVFVFNSTNVLVLNFVRANPAAPPPLLMPLPLLVAPKLKLLTSMVFFSPANAVQGAATTNAIAIGRIWFRMVVS